MRSWSRRRALALGAAGALAVGSAGAEPDPPAASEAGAAPAEKAEPAAPDTRLADILDARTGANRRSVRTQQVIEQLSDETDKLLTQYRTAEKQIASLSAYNRQMEEIVAGQRAEAEDLLRELEQIEEVARDLTPLMLRMIAALEAFVELDVPFLPDERRERIEGLRALMRRADVTESEKYRGIMEAYQIENEYGRTIEAYRSMLSRDGEDLTVDFLRVGRIGLVYQTLDQQEAGVWDQQARRWVPLDAEHADAIRNGLRIARKQVPPDLIHLPLPPPEDAEPAS